MTLGGIDKVIELAYCAELGQRLTSVIGEDLDDRYGYERSTGRLASAGNSCYQQSFEYSPTGLPRASQLRGSTDGRNLDATYAHSLRGRLVGMTETEGNQLAISYDALGRPHATTFNQVTSISRYDAHGRLDQIVTRLTDGGEQQTSTLTYDDFSREIRRDLVIDDGGIEKHRESLELDFDVENRICERRRYRGGELVLTESYDYDVQSRLVDYRATGEREWLPVAGTELRVIRQVFEYNFLDAITRVLTTFDDDQTDTAVYSYQNPLDPTQVSAIERSNPHFALLTELSYDPQGNLIAKRSENGPWSYRYSSAGRLVDVAVPNRSQARYDYDAFGRLGAVKVADDLPVSLTYLGDNVIAESQAAAKRYFVKHQGFPVAEGGDAAGDRRLLASDHLCSVIGSYQSDSKRENATYLPFGSGRGVSSGRQFVGHLKDTHSGLYLLGDGTRAYDPEIGVFLSADGWSPFEMGGVNPYVYCKGNPINLIDPNAHMSSGASLGLNVFFFVLDAVVLGIAVAAAVVSGGASLAVGATIVGASLGLVSDTLGIAADSMTIKDDRHGVTDRAGTIQNLGLASASIGVAAMAVDLASMAGESVGVVRSAKGARSRYRAQGQHDRVLIVSAKPVSDDLDGLRWELFHGQEADLWRTDLSAAPDRPLPRKGGTAYSYNPEKDEWREFKVRSSTSWSGVALDFLGRSTFEEVGSYTFHGNRKTVARGVGLLTGSGASASGIASLVTTTWEVSNGDEGSADTMDVYGYLEQKLPVTPTV
ncbi:MAG: hypothetical protein HC897_02610 [Thermoanaerobaculia bacterium]|nr:hypothetical protein [Thermoanaerobaculia bacterium]